jgi:hypothetical protein
MTKQVQLANSLLWASAIVASAVFQAPAALTLLVLPSLAAAAWVVILVRSNSKVQFNQEKENQNE